MISVCVCTWRVCVCHVYGVLSGYDVYVLVCGCLCGGCVSCVKCVCVMWCVSVRRVCCVCVCVMWVSCGVCVAYVRWYVWGGVYIYLWRPYRTVSRTMTRVRPAANTGRFLSDIIATHTHLRINGELDEDYDIWYLIWYLRWKYTLTWPILIYMIIWNLSVMIRYYMVSLFGIWVVTLGGLLLIWWEDLMWYTVMLWYRPMISAPIRNLAKSQMLHYCND